MLRKTDQGGAALMQAFLPKPGQKIEFQGQRMSFNAHKLVAVTVGVHALAGLAVGDGLSGHFKHSDGSAFVGPTARAQLLHGLHPALCCRKRCSNPPYSSSAIRMILSEERSQKDTGIARPAGLQRGSSIESAKGAIAGAGDSVCFDGGCMTDSFSSMEKSFEMLDRELEELSETERRLKREGALMLLEKLRSQGVQSSSSVGPAKQVSPTPQIEDEDASSVESTSSLNADAEQSIISARLAGRAGPTVWSEFGALAAQTKGVNLGQGFPNWSPPAFVTEAAVEAISKGGAAQQYTRTAGHPPLCALLAARYTSNFAWRIPLRIFVLCLRYVHAPICMSPSETLRTSNSQVQHPPGSHN
jgi:hypothetical protein